MRILLCKLKLCCSFIIGILEEEVQPLYSSRLNTHDFCRPLPQPQWCRIGFAFSRMVSSSPSFPRRTSSVAAPAVVAVTGQFGRCCHSIIGGITASCREARTAPSKVANPTLSPLIAVPPVPSTFTAGRITTTCDVDVSARTISTKITMTTSTVPNPFTGLKLIKLP